MNAISISATSWFLLACSQLLAATPAAWLAPRGGDWEDAKQWSTDPYFPDNGSPSGSHYEATVSTLNSNATLTLNSSVSLDQLNLASGILSVKGTLACPSVQAAKGLLQLNGGTLNNAHVSGNFQLAAGFLTNITSTVTGSTLSSSFSVPTYATLNVSDATLDACTVMVYGNGGEGQSGGEFALRTNLSGNGTISMIGSDFGGLEVYGKVTTGSNITISAAYGRCHVGGPGTLINDGTFLVQNSTLGAYYGNDTYIRNEGTFICDAGGGVIKSANVGYDSASYILDGGCWKITNGSALSFMNLPTVGLPGQNVAVRNNATIVLDGGNSRFVSVTQNITENDKSLALFNGNDIVASSKSFSNVGLFHLGVGCDFRNTGSFAQAAAGQLEFDLAGFSDEQYGQVAVPGDVTLDGALSVFLINGFDPELGSTFRLITGGSIAGGFARVQLPPLSGGKFFQLVTTPTSLSLVVVPEPSLIGGAGLLIFFGRARHQMKSAF